GANDGVDAILRELEVVFVARALVGVAGDLDERELGVMRERGRDGVEDLVRLRQDLGARGLELDLVEDDDVVVLNDDAPLVGAAVFVLEAVERLRIVRALVLDVGDAVLVVVRVGAAVGVLEAIAILGLIGALVELVGNAVAVAIAVATLGAAVFVLVAVAVFRHVGAPVVDVEDPVVVVVGIGATVGVLEAVEVFGIVGALVDVVLDPVAVADRGLEDEPEEDALVRGLEAAGVPDAAAEHQVGVSLGEELDTPDRL